MSTTHDRAERLLHQAEHDANAYADRVGGDFRTARAYELGLLRGAIRDLCIELDAIYAKRPHLAPSIPAGLPTTRMESFDTEADKLQRDMVAFHNRSTGAAAALRGEPL